MRKIFVLATLAFFAAAGPAAAQGTFGFGAHAGVSIPTGDYGDEYGAELGFLGGLDLTYPLLMVTPGLNWYTSVDAIAHSVDDEALVGFEPDGGYLYVPIMTGLQFQIPAGMIRPFVNAQLGWVFHKGPSFGAGDISESEWGSDFGFVVGGGAFLTENVYAGLKYYPLDISFQYEGETNDDSVDVSFLDIYVGFGVF